MNKVILLTLLSLLLLISCKKQSEERQEIIRPVRYTTAKRVGGEKSRSFSGVSKAGTEAKLSFRVSGLIQKLNIKVGDKIRKGKIIATVDKSDAQLQYEKSLVALQKSRIQRQTAQSNLARTKQLYENNSVPLSSYESAKSNYATANSAYNADRRNVNLQKRSLTYYTLKAPMNGVVSAVYVSKNENMQPGTVIALISTTNDIEVNVGIPEAFISRISSGDSVAISFSSLPQKEFQGVVSEVSYALSSQSSTYPVTIKLLKPTAAIRPGMATEVTFDLSNEAQEERIIVPATAIASAMDRHFLFTLSLEGEVAKVIKKEVTLGAMVGTGFEILSGLEAGEQVVTAGVSKLSNGIDFLQN